MIDRITQDSVAVQQAAQVIHKLTIEMYITPLFTLALFIGNAVLWLPEAMLPYKPWRTILLKFYSDDDGLFNKTDLKDGAVVTLAYWFGKFAIHFGTYDVLTGKDNGELIYQLLGAAALFLGINAGISALSRTTKNKAEN